MRFRYIGNPRDLLDLHPQITAFGLTFPLDEPVEVTEPRAIRKLTNNTHFEAVPGDGPAIETGAGDLAVAFTPEQPLTAAEPPVPPTLAPTSPSPPMPRGGRRRG